MDITYGWQFSLHTFKYDTPGYIDGVNDWIWYHLKKKKSKKVLESIA